MREHGLVYLLGRLSPRFTPPQKKPWRDVAKRRDVCEVSSLSQRLGLIIARGDDYLMSAGFPPLPQMSVGRDPPWGREHRFEYIFCLRCPLSAPGRSSKALIRCLKNVEFQTKRSCLDTIFWVAHIAYGSHFEK